MRGSPINILMNLSVTNANCGQRGQMGKGFAFTATLIKSSEFNPNPGHVVTSLEKTLRNDYLCLVASKKQQESVDKNSRNPQEHWISGNSKADAGSF